MADLRAFWCQLRVNFARAGLALSVPVVVGAAPPAQAPGEIVTAAPAADWVAIKAEDLLVMDLAPRKDGPSTGSGRRVVIQLMPPPFSQGWVGNIRKLAAARWWDGTSINRVQDNYVVQWGDASEKKALPANLAKQDGRSYTINPRPLTIDRTGAFASLRHENALPTAMLQNETGDAYARLTAFRRGWPVALSGLANGKAWPIHCYGMVGVGRGMPPDTGSGAELYTVIGHAPRHLDRNIALVGRVIEGIEHLSSLPRGTGALGFYEKPEERVPIVSVRLGNEVKDLLAYQYLSTESESFARYADARANRRDAFFIQPAGGTDICNIPVPVRRAP